MHLEVRWFLGWVMLLTMISSVSLAEVVERRRDQFGRDFAYYVYRSWVRYPAWERLPEVGVSVSNMGGSDTDFTGYYVRGDIKATGAALLNYHVLPERLIFDGAITTTGSRPHPTIEASIPTRSM